MREGDDDEILHRLTMRILPWLRMDLMMRIVLYYKKSSLRIEQMKVQTYEAPCSHVDYSDHLGDSDHSFFYVVDLCGHSNS